MTARLLAKLPTKGKNGLAPIVDDVTEDDPPRYAVVELITAFVGRNAETKEKVVEFRVGAVEPVPVGSDDETALRERLAGLYEVRRANGQLSLDDAEPTLMAEKLAELTELADDLGVDPPTLKTEFADYYGHPPEGGTPVELDEFLFRRRQDVPAPTPAADDDTPPASDGDGTPTPAFSDGDGTVTAIGGGKGKRGKGSRS